MSAVRSRLTAKFMDQALLDALGNFFLGAIPTVILVLLIFTAYNFLIHRPLNRVLTERRERTAGAIARAQADIAAAEHKTAEYERRLLEARQAIFKVQEGRRKKVLKAREAALAEARREADAMMREAAAVLKREISEAKQRLQAEAEKLSAAVIRTILRPVTSAPASGGRQ